MTLVDPTWILARPGLGAYLELDALAATLEAAQRLGVEAPKLAALRALLDAEELGLPPPRAVPEESLGDWARAQATLPEIARQQLFLVALDTRPLDERAAQALAEVLGLTASEGREFWLRWLRVRRPEALASPALADLFEPPQGFTPPVGARAAATLARETVTLSAFWARCSRADWMLYALGWHRFELRPVAAAAARVVRAHEPTPALGPAWRELQRVEEWAASDVASRTIDWVSDFGGAALEEAVASGRHHVESAIGSLVNAVKHGRNLGPATPMVLANIATCSARSLVPLERWPKHPAALSALGRSADILRASLDPSVLDRATPPRSLPASWTEARTGWPQLFEP